MSLDRNEALTELKLREELERRKILTRSLFPQQFAVANTEHRKVAIKTSGRAGKTRLLVSIFLERLLQTRNKTLFYIALTQKNARHIVWPIVQQLKRDYDLKIDLKSHELEIHGPMGSKIFLYGADREDLQDRLFGIPTLAVALDECAVWQTNLRRFCNEVLIPRLMDEWGHLYLAGTPGEIMRGYFYDITRDDKDNREMGWEVHEWTIADNPHMARQWEKQQQEFLGEYGEDYILLPWFLRQYKGLWCAGDENAVYAYNNEVNAIDEHMILPGDRFILGIDTGWSDGMAFVMGCYNSTEYPDFVILESYWEPQMTIDEIAKKIGNYRDKYHNVQIVADYNNAQLNNELRARYKIPLQNCEKMHKVDWIRLINNEFLGAKIKICSPESENYPLARELVDLRRKYAKDNSWCEVGDNHCCDAMLYAYRYAYHYRYKEKPALAVVGSDEWAQKIEQRIWKGRVREMKKKHKWGKYAGRR